ncbi:hypothetical protein TR74_03335, partial [Carbonactinospora thermoautotrophica]
EYLAVLAQANEAAAGDEVARAQAARRLRAELRRIARRDYFPLPERQAARAAVEALTAAGARGAVRVRHRS